MQTLETRVESLQKRHENLLQNEPITEPSFEAFNVKSGDRRLHLQQHRIDTTSFILVSPIYTLYSHSTSPLYCAGYSKACARPKHG
jgi:hypothetical protein